METVFERVCALDVHKAQVTVCVRVPAAAGRREQQLAEFQTTTRELLALRRLARRVRRYACGDGGDRGLLEAGLGGARGRLCADALQCPPRQAGAGPQDRCLGRGVAVPADGSRTLKGELRAAEADPPGCGRSRAIARRRSRSANERRTASTRRSRTPASRSTAWRLTSSAPPAARCSMRSARARPNRSSWPSSPRGGCAPSCRSCARRSRDALRPTTRL